MSYKPLNLSIIKFLVSQKKLSLTDLADRIGITYVGLSKIIRENSTSLTTLEKIAEELNVPLLFFFMDETEVVLYSEFSLDSYKALKQENEKLKAEISDLKNKIIRLSDKLVR